MTYRKTVWHHLLGMVFLLLAVLVLLLLLISFGGVKAQEPGDPVAGRQLAQTWCSTCHVVTRGQQQATSNGAPSFAAIAAQKSFTPMALSAFLQTPHHRMPDLHLSRDEIDDISAYIFSLRHG